MRSIWVVLVKHICLFGLLASCKVMAVPEKNQATGYIKPPNIQSSAHILIDFHSNKVLAEHNSHQEVEPASLTKMMTMYVIDKALQNHQLHREDKVTISTKAWQAPGSRMFVEVGSKVAVSELIKGIIIQSGNDACIALAEYYAGSESSFVDMMNSQANALGMLNTHFANSTGLPHPEHLTTAYDMALLAKAIIEEFPESYQLYAQKNFTYNNIMQTNRNRLLWHNELVDGIKTGHTDSAGYCLVASAKQQQMRLIAVILGTKNDELRTQEGNKLLTWGFRTFETKRIYQANESLQAIKVWLGAEKNLRIGVAKDIYVTLPYGQFNKINVSLDAPKAIKAPLELGQSLGTYTVKFDDEIIKQQPLIALDAINKGTIWHQFKDIVHLNINLAIDKLSKK